MSQVDFSVCVDDPQDCQIDLGVRADSYLPLCAQSENDSWRCMSVWVKVTVVNLQNM